MPIKANLQPSVKEILLHLVTQGGKSSHRKSSILLTASAELDEVGWEDLAERTMWGRMGK